MWEILKQLYYSSYFSVQFQKAELAPGFCCVLKHDCGYYNLFS